MHNVAALPPLSERRDLAKAFAESLVALGHHYPQIIVVDADLPDSCGTESFHEAHPGRGWDLGIAEQSLPTVSAGLAMGGWVPIYNSFAVFAVHRGVDMIRQAVCYNRANVKIVGHCAGQSMGYTGPSHHTVEDIALLRAIPRMTILQPADAIELHAMMFAMVEHEGPVYLRLPRATVEPVHPDDYAFRLGQPDLLKAGTDITIYVTGEPVARVMKLAHRLETERGISLQIVNIPTLKPLDPDALVALARRTRGAVTVEDHNVLGGLGGAIAEIYGQHLPQRVIRVGINDTFTESAAADRLQDRYGLSDTAIENAITTALS